MTVAAGIKTYMEMFFPPQGGYISVEESNPNYLLLLELFRLLEDFLMMLDRGLKKITEKKRNLCPNIIKSEEDFRNFLDKSYTKRDEYQGVHKEIRERCRIDELMA